MKSFYQFLNTYDLSIKNILCVADENTAIDDIIPLKNAVKNLYVLTNRYDAYTALNNADVRCIFNDFDLNVFKQMTNSLPLDCVIYAVSKERAVCHRVFNQISSITNKGAQLVLIGKKQQGIKTYHNALVKKLGYKGTLTKNGDEYIGALDIPNSQNPFILDDKDYTNLRLGPKHNSIEFYTKPGLYGWNKVDQGSLFLLETLKKSNAENLKNTQTLLDLGCGYGFLSIAAVADFSLFPQCKEIVLTDNNAAAVSAAKINTETYLNNQNNGHKTCVIADDCAESISEKFDIVLCNPPFHQGFTTSKDLTEKFIASASKRLSKTGTAAFVTNAFIGIENIANAYFRKVEIAENNKQFKVLYFQQPIIG